MIKAIDAQQVIIQTEKANRVQQVDRQHPEMQQRYLDIQAREEKKLLQKAIKSSEETERAVIRDEEQKENRREQQGRQGQASDSFGENEEEDMPQEGGHINIRV
ncbi:MAG: hypothetical protein M0P74_01515 [Syntrophales bacterium]|nr:hypothetical protein [Syntrophales bacterium]